jgi:hypothetical protein
MKRLFLMPPEFKGAFLIDETTYPKCPPEFKGAFLIDETTFLNAPLNSRGHFWSMKRLF